ncbi:MAG: hypothetical protein WC055_02100 [Melioribacteraceae bacterium]
MAVNDSMFEFISQEMGYEDQRNPENFQWVQRIRDNLYPLIKTSNPTISNGTAVTSPYYTSIPTSLTLPSDYDTFISLQYTISSITYYARPTSFNEIGPLLEDSFKHPANDLGYFNESTSSITLWRGSTGTVSSALLTYLKIPNTFSIGQDNQAINTGGTLTNAITYYALETSVYAGVTYYMGAVITGTGAALTSGSVIAVSNTVALELPAKVHERICKMASEKLLKVIGMFDASAAIESEAQKQ